jgi:hypothetical protein
VGADEARASGDERTLLMNSHAFDGSGVRSYGDEMRCMVST